MVTMTSYLPIGRSPSASRSMWITKVSPTAPAGSPEALCNMPDASIATWPCGSQTTRKIVAASAGMVRCTSKRSVTSRDRSRRSSGLGQISRPAPEAVGAEVEAGPGAIGVLRTPGQHGLGLREHDGGVGDLGAPGGVGGQIEAPPRAVPELHVGERRRAAHREVLALEPAVPRPLVR